MLTQEKKKELEEEIRAYVGRPISPPTPARDSVNEHMIRHWCDAMGDELTIYLDPEKAAKSVHGRVVAPPAMLQAWTMEGFSMHEGYDVPRNEEHRLHKRLTEAGYTGVLGTDIEQEFHRYLAPGDRVTVNTVIDHISEEKATGVGTGYFITTRSTWTDEAGEEVGWLSFRVLKFIPKDPPKPADDGGSAVQATPGRIKPPRGHDNAWWWDEVATGKLPIQRCTGCGKLRHPPRPMCDSCGDTSWDFIDACGRGTLHSFTIIRHPQFPGYEFPIIAALVDLEEGPRMISNIVDCDPADVEIGMKLQSFIHEDPDGFKLPLFRPAK